MILILAEAGTEPIAGEIAQSITAEYGLSTPPEMVAAGAPWTRAVEWDDVLIVVYENSNWPTDHTNYIDAYLKKHTTGGPVIPVSTDPANRRPPGPISGIKAGVYDGTPQATAQIVMSTGVFLGLALTPGRQRIFISYRAADGTVIANDLHDRLKAAGFVPWLDEADKNLQTGDDVQQIIRQNIDSAAMILLLDTPAAPQSRWIKIEVDLAIGELLPVLPVVMGGDQISRFLPLKSLPRRALAKLGGLDGTPLRDAEWDVVLGEIQQLLLLAYRRRRFLLARAQAVFAATGFQWQVVDDKLRMYRADRKKTGTIRTNAFCHCLIHDIMYIPALKAYWKYLGEYPGRDALNRRVCIYDRDTVLSDAELESIDDELPNVNLVLAHQSELDTVALEL